MYVRVFNSKKVADQRKLKSDILAAKAELLQTSAQDQFAKWAKLRRKVDKDLADLEKLSEFSVPSLRDNVLTNARQIYRDAFPVAFPSPFRHRRAPGGT